MTARPRRVILLRPVTAPAAPPTDPAALPAQPPTAEDRAADGSAPGEAAAPRPIPAGDLLRPGAAAAAAVVLGTSAGHGFIAVVALAVAAGATTGVVAGLGLAAAVARWGTADLGLIAGDQAVLGVAIGTGDLAEAASSALAGLALLLASRRHAGPWPAAVPIALGLGAAALAAGPAATGGRDLAVRVVASVMGAGLAVGVARVVGARPALDRPLRVAAVGVAAVALLLAVPA